MATHSGTSPSSEGAGETTGTTASTTTSSGSGSAVDRVATSRIDEVRMRAQSVANLLDQVAAVVPRLASYRPTQGGIADKTWDGYVADGYGKAAIALREGVEATRRSVDALATGLGTMSTTFTAAEEQAVESTRTLRKSIGEETPTRSTQQARVIGAVADRVVTPTSTVGTPEQSTAQKTAVRALPAQAAADVSGPPLSTPAIPATRSTAQTPLVAGVSPTP